MTLLLIFILLKSGQMDVRTSIVYGIAPEAQHTCEVSLPLTVSLYQRGKFLDGPPKELIKRVRGRCEPVEEENKITMEYH